MIRLDRKTKQIGCIFWRKVSSDPARDWTLDLSILSYCSALWATLLRKKLNSKSAAKRPSRLIKIPKMSIISIPAKGRRYLRWRLNRHDAVIFFQWCLASSSSSFLILNDVGQLPIPMTGDFLWSHYKKIEHVFLQTLELETIFKPESTLDKLIKNHFCSNFGAYLRGRKHLKSCKQLTKKSLDRLSTVSLIGFQEVHGVLSKLGRVLWPPITIQ